MDGASYKKADTLATDAQQANLTRKNPGMCVGLKKTFIKLMKKGLTIEFHIMPVLLIKKVVVCYAHTMVNLNEK